MIASLLELEHTNSSRNLLMDIKQLFAEGEVKIGKYNKYSPMITEPEANNIVNIIFRGEYQGLQNNGLKHKNTDGIVRVHTRTVCSRS